MADFASVLRVVIFAFALSSDDKSGNLTSQEAVLIVADVNPGDTRENRSSNTKCFH